MNNIHRNSLVAGLVATLSLALAAPAYARGPLPDPAVKEFQRLVDAAYARYKGLQDGKNASYIKILTETPSELFGVVIVTADGKVYKAGDVDYKFSIQSVSKPFTAALVMTQQSPEVLQEKVGVEPTGMAFNSKLALAIYEKAVNPMVNAGAIGSVSLVQADSEEERWNKILQNLSDFAGEETLPVLEKVFESEYSDCEGNRGIAHLLRNWGKLYCDPEEALKVYTHAMLRRRERARPGHDGRHHRQRRQESQDRQASDEGRRRAGTAGRHGHRRLL